jgi:delta 1-pyrroline-5-carboxylate dehydrogenase
VKSGLICPSAADDPLMTKLLAISKRPRLLEERSSLVEQVRSPASSIHRIALGLTTAYIEGDDSKGYFIQPTVILSKDPKSVTLVEEIFGPVLTVSVLHLSSMQLTDICNPGIPL